MPRGNDIPVGACHRRRVAHSKIRVLVVDDSSIWRTFLIGHLHGAGLTLVYVAYDGVQAVYKARTLQPDLVLMDVSLPHMNGIQAASYIRTAAPDAKIVFLSSNSDPGIKAIEERLRAGPRRLAESFERTFELPLRAQ